jgi:hypothetical protein
VLVGRDEQGGMVEFWSTKQVEEIVVWEKAVVQADCYDVRLSEESRQERSLSLPCGQ